VPCRRFASVLEEFGVLYYMKVEGDDILCLANELITTLKELEEQKWFSWEECWVDIHGRID
jgi:hypothetical protein